MKPQDLVFAIVLLFLVLRRKPEWFVYAGLISLMISIPLFYFWVFFTAQRLTYYAAGFILISIILNLKYRK